MAQTGCTRKAADGNLYNPMHSNEDHHWMLWKHALFSVGSRNRSPPIKIEAPHENTLNDHTNEVCTKKEPNTSCNSPSYSDHEFCDEINTHLIRRTGERQSYRISRHIVYMAPRPRSHIPALHSPLFPPRKKKLSQSFISSSKTLFVCTYANHMIIAKHSGAWVHSR